MASIRKRGDRWQARVSRKGYPEKLRTFDTKTDAERWARSIERDIDRGSYNDTCLAARTTLGEIAKRYAEEVCPLKRGGMVEQRRLEKFQRDPICRVAILNIKPQDAADYRDRRSQSLQSSTLNREIQLLRSIVNHACREWGIALNYNPFERIRMPPVGRSRDRVLEPDEEVRLLSALDGSGYKRVPKVNHNPWVKPIVQLAIETACRRGEILSLEWGDVDLKSRTIHLAITKNGDPRTVPLSSKAVEILQAIPRNLDGRVFPIPWTALHQAFKKACKRAGIVDLKFHDLRHTATSRLAEKLPNVIELSAVTGHKSLAMLKRYYHVKPEVLARKLG